MALVVGIRFTKQGKAYYFNPGDLTFSEGDGAVVETVRGMEYGEVAILPREIPDDEIVSPLKPVIRVATEEDKRRVEQNRVAEKEALVVGTERIEAHGLDMKLVNVEYTFDGKKVVFYFTADGRVDFRELVRDLAARFHTRIELRQIGIRDEARMLGGIGPCGREVCCKSFMTDFIPVSIRMAKDQGLSLNPTKISGLCGRLMCCLQFENDTYVKLRKELPKQGADVITADGPGEITEVEILQGKVKVRVTLPDLSCEVREYLPEEIKIVAKNEREEAQRELADKAPAAVVPKPAVRPSVNRTVREKQETEKAVSETESEPAPKAVTRKVHMWPPREDLEITVEETAEDEKPAEEKQENDRPRRNRHRGGERRHRNGDNSEKHAEPAEKNEDAKDVQAEPEKKTGGNRHHRGSGHRRGGRNGNRGGKGENAPEKAE